MKPQGGGGGEERDASQKTLMEIKKKYSEILELETKSTWNRIYYKS